MGINRGRSSAYNRENPAARSVRTSSHTTQSSRCSAKAPNSVPLKQLSQGLQPLLPQARKHQLREVSSLRAIQSEITLLLKAFRLSSHPYPKLANTRSSRNSTISDS